MVAGQISGQVAGQVISGSFDRIVVRQKSDVRLEIGQLLTARTSQGTILLQVFDLGYGSQLSQQNLELIAGMKLESDNDLELLDGDLRNYTLAYLKPLLLLSEKRAMVCKMLPEFFTHVMQLGANDAGFLEFPPNPLCIGELRSGSKVLEGTGVFLDGAKVFAHHVLVAAQTGRGKSNLMSCLMLSALEGEYAGFLILDPHDEYYGRSRAQGGRSGLKSVGNTVYYTPIAPPAGARSLKIHVRKIRPSHFNGVVTWSEPQNEALYAYFRKYKAQWIESLLRGEDEELKKYFNEATLLVVRRRLLQILSLEFLNGELHAKGIFDFQAGSTTIADIVDELERMKAVIVDTSSLNSQTEVLVGSIIASEIFGRYQRYKLTGELQSKPVISIVLEEAVRVLGKTVLDQGPNVFSRIAREGRKFKVGLTAITQLPSLIPREILANMGTKLVLGMEMAPERKAVIESAAQDLSTDERTIASLDVGEALVTSTFSKFAIPVKMPLFEDLLRKRAQPLAGVSKQFPGLAT